MVPGGSANVFARSLGISPDPVEATNQLVDLLGAHHHDGSWRRIGLMDCGERWAVFTAGLGVDGEVVAAVEAQREKGRKVTASRYIGTAIPLMLRSARREPTMTLELPGRDPISGVHFVFASNSNPWTYVNDPPGVDEPDHHVRDRPRRVRDHQHERVGQSAAGPSDVVQETAHERQAPDPRRRRALAACDIEHTRGVSDRR